MQDTPTLPSLHGLIRRIEGVPEAEQFSVLSSARIAAQFGKMHRQQRITKRRQSGRRVAACVAAVLFGAALVLAIQDAPARTASIVLNAQQMERW